MKSAMDKKSNYDVFLSYSSEDKSWVSEFAAALKDAGVKAWLDQSELSPGDRWQDRIQEALRNSRILVVVLSKNSVESPWTFFELGAAVADQKAIIPVATDGVDISKIPPSLKQYHFLRESSPQAAGKRVAQVIEATSP